MNDPEHTTVGQKSFFFLPLKYFLLVNMHMMNECICKIFKLLATFANSLFPHKSHTGLEKEPFFKFSFWSIWSPAWKSNLAIGNVHINIHHTVSIFKDFKAWNLKSKSETCWIFKEICEIIKRLGLMLPVYLVNKRQIQKSAIKCGIFW